MVTQKEGFELLIKQFPRLRKLKNSKFSASLSFLARDIDNAANKKTINSVSRVFDCINFLINNGSLEVKRLVNRNFFHQLKVIPVHFHSLSRPYEMEIIKKYRIHYNVSRQNGCYVVKSINIDV